MLSGCLQAVRAAAEDWSEDFLREADYPRKYLRLYFAQKNSHPWHDCSLNAFQDKKIKKVFINKFATKIFLNF